jgi:pimeloyl-ACP methyl ester carboxylesterase
VGHSLGGTVAVVIADRSPDFARSLLLIDPAIEFARTQRHETRERLAVDAKRPPSVDELLATNPRWAPEDAHLKRSAVLATEPDVMRDSIDHNDPWLFGDMLAGLDVPTHVLGADPDHDPLFDADLYQRLRTAKPDLTFEVVEGAGHSVFRDDPDAVVAAAVAALEQLPRR